MENQKIGFIGLGLIGGSLAKTIRRKHPEITIIATDIDVKALSDAKEEGTINDAYPTFGPAFYDVSYLFLCAPIRANLEVVSDIKDHLPQESDCIITDVGSMKRNIHEEIRFLGMDNRFIGGHPMAGLETIGYEHANAYLFENVYYIITPEPAVPPERVKQFRAFLESIDVVPIALAVEEHDFATACVSHVPHIISAALVNLVKNNDTSDQVLRSIAAGGFKDITRISSSSPDMWTQISHGNKNEVLPVLDQYIASLQAVRDQICKDEKKCVYNFFSSAKEYRDSISNRTGGAILQSYELFCDIADEEGEIATIATRLATHHINIKNIGIVHNREFEHGVLNIEFYTAQALQEAVNLLHKFHYQIYERN